MNKRTYRVFQIMLTWLTLVVVAGSFYFQYVRGFEPCPLCLMQRLSACILLFLCLAGLSVKSAARAKHVAFLQMAFAMAGLFFALRQLWLQSMPPSTVTCLPGFDMLVRLFPWRELMHVFLWGSNGCAEATWFGLGLSMAAWSALYFALMMLVGAGLFVKRCFVPNRFDPAS